ncbi:Lsr2 family protein [Amycolatopsis sp. DSM 110486]|uniref:histone-like nucleoid-structuring protein Lsr2 n=1 Tax=Amycolatopsis sp. DSM 110486 TaxID=2865832 RepID=UPI001C6A4197|nr:Lsr2 family protein [Amycolatopsis sp. DSM 110486]QYN18715.1 Lsr2 family protein [Amycolatopsis sp. DSM 110486]
MAQKVLIEMLDDIDGSVASQTVPFDLDGVAYEIDLSDRNAAALRDELAGYIAAGRRAGGRKTRIVAEQSTGVTAADRERSRAIRAWAVENGYAVSDRGRLSSEIVAAFEAAQQVANASAEKGARKRGAQKKVAAARKRS